MFELNGLRSKGRNHFKLVFFKDEVSLFVHNVHTRDFEKDLWDEQQIGFGGRSKEAFIDNVIVKQRQEKPIVRESFNKGKKDFQEFAFILFTIIMTNAGLSCIQTLTRRGYLGAAIILTLMVG